MMFKAENIPQLNQVSNEIYYLADRLILSLTRTGRRVPPVQTRLNEL